MADLSKFVSDSSKNEQSSGEKSSSVFHIASIKNEEPITRRSALASLGSRSTSSLDAKSEQSREVSNEISKETSGNKAVLGRLRGDNGNYYILPSKEKDEAKNIVRLPKKDRHGSVKVNGKNEAKCKVRVKKFDKEGNQKLKFNGNFKYGFTKLRKFINCLLAILLVLTLIALSFLYYAFNTAEQAIDKSSIGPLSDILTKGDPLELDKYGRANIVLFGTSEDVEDHGGADLTDSIMVLSFDPATGKANTISIPRDLTYNDSKQRYSDSGLCSAGRMWKVNVAYMCGTEFATSDDPLEKQREGARYAADIIGDITGLDIQYYVKVDYTLLISLVDILGGIDVTPYSDDPRGILDYYTWDENGKHFNLPAGLQHINGLAALNLTRARNDAGGYGLSRSNFDREINQQIVLNGIRQKASESGVLLNPPKMLEVLQAMGDHIVSNIPTAQFKSFGKAANNMVNLISVPLIGTASSIEISLNSDTNQQLTADKKEVDAKNAVYLAKGMVNAGDSQYVAGSVVTPNLGEFQFAGIRAYIRASFDGKSTDEIAEILSKIKATSNSSSQSGSSSQSDDDYN